MITHQRGHSPHIIKGAKISLDAALLENIRSDVHDQVGDDGVLKECALMLKDAPTR
jgi:hypothetical protein